MNKEVRERLHKVQYRRVLKPSDEERFFRNQELRDHQAAEQNRLPFLEAFKTAVNPVLEKYLQDKNFQRVLEVGCGTGFFSRFLAPQWLKERLVSCDINPRSLKTIHNNGAEKTPFMGSVYSLPIRDGSLDAVTGYSSFDSFLFLNQALDEVWRVLKPGGRVILLQDLITELYTIDRPSTYEGLTETVERYHSILIEETEAKGLTILAGKEDYLEGLAVEPIEKVYQRVAGFELVGRLFPILAKWDRGHHSPVMVTSTRESLRIPKEKVDEAIEKWGRILQQNPSLLPGNIQAGPGDLIEAVRMRYLVAEKPVKQEI